jgi:hypothetical protein
MTNEYRQALQAALREYEELGLKRREIDRRLAELAQTIGTLSRLLGHTPTVPMGLTDAIRLVMRGAGLPMTPVEVRDRLRAIGFDVAKYTNDLAAVHTILKRLHDARELQFIRRPDGKQQYAIVRTPLAVALPRDIVAAMYDNAAERDALHATQEPESPPPRRRAPAPRRPKRRSR